MEAALKDRNRGWDAVVVGEGTRCWFGNQFSLIAPRFAAYGVVLLPELGGRFDARNPSGVVVRIFAEYLDGRGDRGIANGLNRDSIPCPSARRPEQNRHRNGDGWQGSTVRAILDNPRYAGSRSSAGGRARRCCSIRTTSRPGT